MCLPCCWGHSDPTHLSCFCIQPRASNSPRLCLVPEPGTEGSALRQSELADLSPVAVSMSSGPRGEVQTGPQPIAAYFSNPPARKHNATDILLFAGVPSYLSCLRAVRSWGVLGLCFVSMGWASVRWRRVTCRGARSKGVRRGTRQDRPPSGPEKEHPNTRSYATYIAPYGCPGRRFIWACLCNGRSGSHLPPTG